MLKLFTFCIEKEKRFFSSPRCNFSFSFASVFKCFLGCFLACLLVLLVLALLWWRVAVIGTFIFLWHADVLGESCPNNKPAHCLHRICNLPRILFVIPATFLEEEEAICVSKKVKEPTNETTVLQGLEHSHIYSLRQGHLLGLSNIERFPRCECADASAELKMS